MGSQLRWLERTPDKREVDGSIPFEPTTNTILYGMKMFEKKHIEKYIEEYNIGKLDIQNLIAILISRIQLNQKKRQC